MAPLLKLCGNHSQDDVAVSMNSSADYIGFVYAKSKRQVTNAQVKEWLPHEGDLDGKKLVALFVHATAEEIEAAIHGIDFHIIQCHGEETPEEVADIKSRTGLPVWKVIHHNDEAIPFMEKYAGIADGYVIDCKVGKEWGGTGVSFDWHFVPSYLAEGKRQGVPVFIAGGVTPNNVEKLMTYEPDGIDLSSGIEENGKKSQKLVRQLEERMNRHGNDLSGQ